VVGAQIGVQGGEGGGEDAVGEGDGGIRRSGHGGWFLFKTGGIHGENAR
jgi:hypothetical protein